MQILFRPRFLRSSLPDVHPEANLKSGLWHSRVQVAEARWISLFGAPGDRRADFEDFHENAIQLFAAIDSGRPTYVLGQNHGAGEVIASFNTCLPFDPNKPFALIGNLMKRDPVLAYPGCCWPRPLSEQRRYGALSCFPDIAGRYAALATFSPDHGDTSKELHVAVQEAVKHSLSTGGNGSVFIKVVTEDKAYQLQRLDHLDPNDISGIRVAIQDALDYTLIRFEGKTNAFLVQSYVDMHYEYRMVVVDGKLIAGAGCVESQTPLDNATAYEGELAIGFDPVVEYTRGDRRFGATSQASVVTKFINAAEVFLEKILAEDPRFRNFTLDLYLAADQTSVGVIECNPLRNFGFYALNVYPVMNAIFAMAEKMHPCPVIGIQAA